MTTAEQHIRAVLSPGWTMTTNEIIEAVALPPNSVRSRLQDLARNGRVERVGRKPARQVGNLRPWDQIEWRIAQKRRGR
jgi:predicted ArsR family transcriptional regulator